MKAYLILEDGTVFCGEQFGAEKETTGELVFNTGMVGYIETLTDPAYYGQIVVQTFPLFGNYGNISSDAVSDKSWVQGYVVREVCEKPSNFRCEENINEFMKRQGIMGISGVDTRQITKIIREKGVMKAKITTVKPENIAEIPAFDVTDAVSFVSTSEKKVYNQGGKYKVALLDLGCRANEAEKFAKYDAEVTMLPYNTPADEIKKYDALIISDGPGNPEDNKGVIETVAELFGKMPIFGISLGHQILALAAGAKTYKLKYGHRGANQPVKRLETGRCYISTQNHGYAVESSSLPSFANISFINVNDNTCAGIDYTEKQAFSVQFYPDVCVYADKSNFLYDRFFDMIGGN